MSTQDDLAYVRSVAERGADAPLGGGRTLLLWGGLITVALLVHWALRTGLLDLPSWSYLAVWLGMVALGWIGTFTVISGSRGGTVTHANQTFGAVWMASGAFLTTFAFAVIGKQIVAPTDLALYDMLLPISTGVYGIAFATSGSVSRDKWLWYIALMAFGFAGAYVFLLGAPILYLLAAVGTALVVFLPGFVLSFRK